MNSFNPQISALHQSYCDATGYDVPLNHVFEQSWLVAAKAPWCLQPDDVKLVLKERIKLVTLRERRTASTYLRNVIGVYGDDDDQARKLAEFQMELAAIRARMRKPQYEAGKVVVLAATNRPTEPEQPPARSVGDVIRAMKEAAQ